MTNPDCPFCRVLEAAYNASDTIKGAVTALAEVGATLVAKNAAYGDSAANPIRIFSRADTVEQLKVRIDDKLSRLARGAGLDGGTDGEDTVRALLGYLAILKAKIATKKAG